MSFGSSPTVAFSFWELNIRLRRVPLREMVNSKMTKWSMICSSIEELMVMLALGLFMLKLLPLENGEEALLDEIRGLSSMTDVS